MGLTTGSRIGPYEIVGALGAGGMGEVYRARDTRLHRDVAIKVLPESLASDPAALARFEREAKAVAALSHPNILSIFDFGSSDATRYAAMELLEGVTLRERLERGALPLRKAVETAVQIAHGLAAAHQKGLVHRDLKPENIFLTPEGRVKILDFGIAKSSGFLEAGGATSTAGVGDATAPGVILGTFGYMAPEQLRGLSVDARTDIFAFGAVLYEMLSGRRAFAGKTPADTMSAVLTGEPAPLVSMDGTSPLALDRLVRRCLEKNPAERFESAHDVALALEAVLAAADSSGVAKAVDVNRGRRRERIAWIAALVIVTALAALSRTWRQAPPANAVNFTLALPFAPYQAERGIALSPDGRTLVYAGGPSNRLHVRRIDRIEPIALEGTEGARNPFFSPDGQWLGFFAGVHLKRVSLAGGAPLVVCDATTARGATWGPDDTIVFAGGLTTGLFQVSAQGGTPKAITQTAADERSHRWPEFLPGGKALLFVVQVRGPDDIVEMHVVAQSLVTGERTTILKGAGSPMFANGTVIASRSGSLVAVPFDPVRLRTAGAPVSVVEGIADNPSGGAAQFAVSQNGALVYVAGTLNVNREIVWVDRQGGATLIDELRRPVSSITLSPDGNRAALKLQDGAADIWIYDFLRSRLSRLTFSPGTDQNPAWAPDGRRVFFAGVRGGPFNILSRAADGGGDDELLLENGDDNYPSSVSPDGRWLLFVRMSGQRDVDVWVLPLEGDRRAKPLFATPFVESRARFSPDGRWIAYHSNASGRFEVYVQPFPPSGGKWQVSSDGGESPVWSPTTRELFYRKGDSLMAVPFESEPSFTAGRPRLLFTERFDDSGTAGGTYDVSPDAKRFIVVRRAEEALSRNIHWFTGWSADVAARLREANGK